MARQGLSALGVFLFSCLLLWISLKGMRFPDRLRLLD